MKFNKLLKNKHPRRTRNLAGGGAFAQSPKQELVTILLTTILEDQYYRPGDATAQRLRELVVGIGDREFVAKAALYARNKAGMRAVSHLVAGELASLVKGAEWTKRFFDRVVRRPDDVLEILAYYFASHGKPIPNSLKKGLGLALARFDAYQLAKYRRSSAEVKLVDAVNLVHPPHTEALAALVNGKIASAKTWESGLAAAGQVAESDAHKTLNKAAVWAELVRTRKIGYLALLRNLRNILEQAPEVMDDALATLVDDRLISRSLVLPFRFGSALDAVAGANLPGSQKVIAALSVAVDKALVNVPRLSGRTLLALDCSGSMIGRPIKIGSLFAAVLYKANDADLMLFSSDAKYVAFDREDATLTIAGRIGDNAEWGGTNFHSIFERARPGYDRVIILSDMQAWVRGHTPKKALAAYAKRSGKRPRVFSFDLNGYGTMQFPEREVYSLAGWSDKTMETLKFLERDKSALVHQIESIEL